MLRGRSWRGPRRSSVTRPNQTSAPLPSRAAEDAAEHAAQDLPAELAADGARGLLGHGFDHALAALGAPEQVAQRSRSTLGAASGLCAGAGSSRGAGCVCSARSAGSESRTPTRGSPACRTSPPTGLRARTAARSSGVIAPIRQRGGAISVRSTGIGTPFSCSVETSASPTPSWEMTLATSSFGFGDEGLGRGAHRLLVARRVGAQRVLDAVPELAEDLVRHVVGELRAEVDADALRADEPHHLLDPLAQRRRRVVEQQVRLVEEERPASACRGRRPRAGSRTAPRAARGGSSNRAAASGSAGRPRGC